MYLRLLIVAALAILPAARLLAQDVVQPPDVENSKYQFQGVVNAGTAYVLSGPGDGYYPVMKLEKGQPVTVVGIKFNWLKIAPPAGSFSYVGSVFVDRRDDGNIGRINRNDVNIRAGSLLNAMKTTVQARLSTNDDVQILGKEDEYLKIKPPAGAYVYINKQFVDPVRAISDGSVGTVAEVGSTGDSKAANGAATTQPDSGATTANSGATANGPALKSSGTPPSIEGEIVTETPAATTAPSQMEAVASGATTAPSDPIASATTRPIDTSTPEEKFGKYEAAFADLNKEPLAEQTIDPLIQQYKSIAKADGLSDTLKRVVDLRIATLQVRSESKTKVLEARQIERENSQKQLALQAEQQELQERLKQNEVQIFAAVGTLQASSLQLGSGTLYRLTDPGTGRTVVYLRTADPKITGLMGQFIGVKGDPTMDAQLQSKVIAPTDAELVDPAKVNGSVAAEIIPPSLMLARQASSN